MNRHAWLMVSGSVWAAMMFLLFQREIRPYFEYQQPPSYELIFRGKRKAEVQRRDVMFAESKIGESESLLEPLPDGGHRMRSRLLMRMKPFGGLSLPNDRAYMTSEFKLDPKYQLTDFRLGGDLQGLRVSARGERQGLQLRVSYDLTVFKGDMLVDFPPDATLSDMFLPYQGGGRLEIGKMWKIKMFDLGNLVSVGKARKVELTELYASVVAREKAPSRQDPAPVWQVEVRRYPTDKFWTYLLWVDDAGTVVEQHMKINKLVCRTVLRERREMEEAEVGTFSWSVEPPR